MTSTSAMANYHINSYSNNINHIVSLLSISANPSSNYNTPNRV